MDENTTWRKEILTRMKLNKENWEDIVHKTISEEELNVKFDRGYGTVEGIPFTVWTKNYVYFPADYDGAEWCASVPRNPSKEAVEHVGIETSS